MCSLHALEVEGEERAARAVVNVRQKDGAGDVEAILVAAQEALGAAVLGDFMGHGVQEVVAEVLVEAAVVGRELDAAGGLAGGVGAETEGGGGELELLGRGFQFAMLRGRSRGGRRGGGLRPARYRQQEGTHHGGGPLKRF